MANLDNFKSFVRQNPVLASYVNDGSMTWQKFYEMYDLYGEENSVWDSYLKEKIRITSSDRNSSSSLDDLINMAKNIDMDKVQNGVSSLQKAVGLFGELFTNNSDSTSSNNYQPRPLYRNFED